LPDDYHDEGFLLSTVIAMIAREKQRLSVVEINKDRKNDRKRKKVEQGDEIETE